MPPVLVPRARRLAQLVSQLRPLLVLCLPSHQPRPVGEERLVDDLDAAGGLSILLVDLVGGQQPGVDELPQDLLGVVPLRAFEDRKQLVPLTHRAGALGRHEVTEHLPHDRHPLRPDPIDGLLGVAGQRAADAADVVKAWRVSRPFSRSRFSHSRAMAKASNGSAPRSPSTSASISSTSSSSENR